MNDHIEVLRGLVESWPKDQHPEQRTQEWVAGYQKAKRECAIELDAALAAMAAQGEACKTCGGRGEVGGHVGQTPEQFDYVSEPCPECIAPQQPEAQAGGEAVAWRWRGLNGVWCYTSIENTPHAGAERLYNTPPPSAVPEGSDNG